MARKSSMILTDAWDGTMLIACRSNGPWLYRCKPDGSCMFGNQWLILSNKILRAPANGCICAVAKLTAAVRYDNELQMQAKGIRKGIRPDSIAGLDKLGFPLFEISFSIIQKLNGMPVSELFCDKELMKPLAKASSEKAGCFFAYCKDGKKALVCYDISRRCKEILNSEMLSLFEKNVPDEIKERAMKAL